jgi:hypothetical protein
MGKYISHRILVYKVPCPAPYLRTDTGIEMKESHRERYDSRRRGPRAVSKDPHQRNVKKVIRHPHSLVDPEEYYEIRGIIEESELKYKLD